MTRQPRFHRLRRGFTLVEMLTTIALISVLMLLVNQLYFDTTEAIGVGIATSDVITKVRATSEQMHRDGQAMTSAGSRGFLAILNHQYAGMAIRRARSGDLTETVRSDQLVFFRDRSDGVNGNIEPLVGGGGGPPYAFSNDVPNCNHIKVWYGHGLPTGGDGADAALNASEVAPMDLGKGPNKTASEWVLARQAMFLQTDDTGSTRAGQTGPPATQLPRWNQDIKGGWVNTVPAGIPRNVYMGLVDVGVTKFTDASSNLWWGMDAIQNSLTPAELLAAGTTYKAEAYKYLYGYERLRLNLYPQYSNSNPVYRYQAWQVAQMHPVLIANCSDFIVDFAADISTGTNEDNTPDGALDTDPIGPVTGTDKNGRPFSYTGGNIRWYTHPGFENDPTDATNYDSTKPVTYGVPALYTPYDANANAGASPTMPASTAAFVWQHDDPSNWPYMLRLRYRLHDRKGRLTTATAGSRSEQGKWFEQVIYVNRN